MYFVHIVVNVGQSAPASAGGGVQPGVPPSPLPLLLLLVLLVPVPLLLVVSFGFCPCRPFGGPYLTV